MATAFACLVWLMAGIVTVQVARRATLWRQGAPAAVDWIGGVLALPKRYLVDVHAVVARDTYASRMHALVAGGLLAASLLTALALLPTFTASRPYWALTATAFALCLAGSLLVGARRAGGRPRRLSGGAFQLLPVLLIAYALGGLLLAGLLAAGVRTTPALLPPFLVAAAGGLGLAAAVRQGPMRHALAGALHLIAHPRPARFLGRPDTALTALDLDAPRLGADLPADFTWNRLLSFDACVQCGRCEEACPAFAARQPLSPKHFIQDLVRGFAPDTPAYAGEPYPGLPHAQERQHGAMARLVGPDGLIGPETLWSCTTCRACVEECPMMIEHVDAIVGLRRFQTLERGELAEKAVAPLAELRATGTLAARPLSARTDFAAGLDVRVLQPGESVDVLLWLGEGAFDLRYGRTLRALVRLLRLAGVDFAVLGAAERDTGDVARRLGDEATFQSLARANIATLSTRSFRRIVTADPHALHVLRNEYVALGGTYDVVHHTTVLRDLLEAGRLTPRARTDLTLTYHDPCYLARYNGEVEAPREILDRIASNRVEMARSGRRAMCCGGGGGAPLSDIPGERRIPDLRMAQVASTGATIVAVACPSCAAMLEGVTDRSADVRDVAELLLAAVETET